MVKDYVMVVLNSDEKSVACFLSEQFRSTLLTFSLRTVHRSEVTAAPLLSHSEHLEPSVQMFDP